MCETFCNGITHSCSISAKLSVDLNCHTSAYNADRLYFAFKSSTSKSIQCEWQQKFCKYLDNEKQWKSNNQLPWFCSYWSGTYLATKAKIKASRLIVLTWVASINHPHCCHVAD